MAHYIIVQKMNLSDHRQLVRYMHRYKEVFLEPEGMTASPPKHTVKVYAWAIAAGDNLVLDQIEGKYYRLHVVKDNSHEIIDKGDTFIHIESDEMLSELQKVVLDFYD